MQLISKFNNGFRFFLSVIDIFKKYAWVVPLKDKKGVSDVNAFQKKYQMIQIESKIKYGLKKEVNLTTILFKNGYEIMILKCIRYIMKENLFLLKDMLEL